MPPFAALAVGCRGAEDAIVLGNGRARVGHEQRKGLTLSPLSNASPRVQPPASRSRLAILVVSVLSLHCGRDEATDECSSVDFASALEGSAAHCVEIPVSTLEDGSSTCRAFAGSSRAECDCGAAGRKPPRQGECQVELQVIEAPGSYSCVCELSQLSGAALGRCLNEEHDTSDGWCYAARSPACGPPAADAVVAACESGQRFKLQGGAALADDETLLLDCYALACE